MNNLATVISAFMSGDGSGPYILAANLFLGYNNELWLSDSDSPTKSDLVDVKLSLTSEVMQMFIVCFGSNILSARAKVRVHAMVEIKSNGGFLLRIEKIEPGESKK